MKLLWKWGSLAILATHALAQDGLPAVPAGSSANTVEAASVPFAPVMPSETDLSNALTLSDNGRSALENGFVSVAVYCFKTALAIPKLDSSTTDSLNLDLAAAYLSEGQLDPAAAALQGVTDTSTPAYRLRAALLESRRGQWDGANGAEAQLAGIDSSKLSPVDFPWYFAAQAGVAEHLGNADAAKTAWQQAIDHAPPLLQGRFELALGASQILLSKTPTPEEVEKMHQAMTTATIPAMGAQSAAEYAIGLDQLGQHDAALAVVKHWVNDVTDLDHKNRDTLRLLWVYLDDQGPAPADATLRPDAPALLEAILQEPIDSNSPDRAAIKQMEGQALSLLEQKVFTDKHEGIPAVTDPAALEKFVDGILADSDANSHPLLEQLYLFKARLALLLNQPDQAQTAASNLLAKFPPGQDHDAYITGAQLVLAQVYWHDGQPGGQPRLAISNLRNVYESLPPAQQPPIERSLACMYFMNGDYPNAADFYARLLKSPGPDSPLSQGGLLLRAVESDLRAKQIDAAKAIMDDPVSLVGVTSDDRWRAEWNLLIGMLDQNHADDAFLRLNHLLDPGHGANLLQPDLYLRLLWLHAYLAVGRSEPEAGKIVEVLQKEAASLTPEAIAGLSIEERKTLADLLPGLLAEAMLLQGTAEGQAQQFDQQHKTFELLRQTYPGTDPALNSYSVEASVLEGQNKLVDAQRLMNTVSDNFPNSSQAPYALYMSAVYSNRLGKTPETLNLLQKFVEKYKDDPAQRSRLYDVRLSQAALEASLGTPAGLENAREVYDALIKTLDPNDPRMISAKVNRAVSLYDLATLPDADPQRREDAMDELNGLNNQPNLPVDDRVEVGYMYGKLLEYGSKSDPDAAAAQFWLVIKGILLNEKSAAELDHTAYGRVWMGQCLAELRKILVNEHKDDEVAKIDALEAQYNLGPVAPPAAPAQASPVAPAAATLVPASAPAQATAN